MKNHLLNLIFLTSFLISQPPDSWCEILPTNTSGVFQGIATTAGVPAESGDWVGAVDSDGNCAGAGELIIDNGTAYMNLTIYGDDLLSGDVDEGINSGESFTLMLWDNSAEQTLTLSEQFDCWTNNSGAPMDGCGGLSNTYDFQLPAPGPQFSSSLTIGGDGSSYDLTFGFHPDATDGYDDSFDFYAPPAPPPPAFDAALMWGGERYYTQILNGSSSDLTEHVYEISMVYGSDNVITVTWSNEGYAESMSSAIIQDAFGGAFINVNMTDGSGTVNPAFGSLDVSDPANPIITLINTAVTTLKLLVTPTAPVDDPPLVSGIPDQEVESPLAFSSFDLDDYLTELDGDVVSWSYEITAPPEPGFAETITASSSDGTYDMTFGFHPDATDGYDENTDYYAPPAPPPPAFDAALQWNGERYYTQILAFDGDNSEHEYDITVQYGSDNQVTLAWDNTGWSDLMSSCMLQDAFGGIMINVDMLSQSSFTNTNTAFTLFKLKVTPLPEAMQARNIMVDIDEDNVATLSYSSGWTGSEVIVFTATDQTAEGLSGSDNATFTVSPGVDEAPVVGDIPDQSVDEGQSFSSFDLDDYLTELDGDDVAWSYEITAPPEPGFFETITATAGESSYGMTFGFHPDATDGYDEDTDYYAPPAPPPPAFDAALQWNGERYYTQILAFDGDNSEHEYDVTVQYGSDNQVTLSWDNTGWSDLMSSCLLQDAFGGVMINVDMLSQSSFTNTNTAFTLFKLKVTPLPGAMQTRDIMVDIDEDNVATVSYNAGWTGSEVVTFTATDQTAEGLSGSDQATFTVLDMDFAPQVGGIPDQTTNPGSEFESFDLDDYLTELDGDAVEWSYDIPGQAPEPGFAEIITASSEGGTYDMTFGFHPDATDGYDENTDYYAPPAPPPPAFDAALQWNGERYYTQILAFDGDNSEHEYDITVQYGSDNQVTLAWDNTGWSDLMSSCMLQDAFGGVMINVDMLSQSSFTNTNTAFTLFKLKVTPLPEAVQTRLVMVDIDENNVATVSYETGWTGSEEIVFTATDQTEAGLSGSDAAVFTVLDNSAPVADDQSVTLNEDESLAITLTAADGEGDPLSYSVLSGPSNGSLSGDAPELTYTPNENYNGSDSFTFQVSDGSMTDDGTVNITVNPVNDAPVLAEIGDQSVWEDGTVELLLSSSDIDGGDPSYSASSDESNVSILLNGEELTLRPAQDWNGMANITVTVDDGSGGTDSETFELTVSPVDDPPVLAEIGDQSVDEDGTVNLVLSSSDVDGDDLSYSASSDESNVSILLDGEELTLIPAQDWNGMANITVTVVDDPAGWTDSETFELTVTPVNDAPIVGDIPDQAVGFEENFVTFDLDDYLTEVDGDAVEWSYDIPGQTRDIMVDIDSDNVATVTYADGWSGSEEVIFTATEQTSDMFSDSDAATFTVTEDPNTAPVADDQSVTLNEDESLDITLTATDSEGDPLSYSVLSGPLNGSLSGDAPELTYTPNENYNGSDSFTFQVSDGSMTDDGTVNITVNPVNDAPVLAEIGDQSVDEDGTVELLLSSSDIDGDDLTYSASSDESNVSVSIGDMDMLTVIPATDWNGTASITVTVDDGSGGTDSATFELTVNPVNDAPVLAEISDQSTAEDQSISVSLSATDIDGDNITYSTESSISNVSIIIIGSVLTMVPDENFNGAAIISVTASDGMVSSNTVTFTVTFTPVNDAPVLISIDDQSTDEDVSIQVPLSATDVDGDELSYSAVSVTENISVSIAGSILTLTPAENFNGNGIIIVSANDGFVESNTVTFTLTVTSVNDAPVVEDLTAEVNEDESASIELTGTDIDGDNLTFSVVEAPVNGIYADGVYTPEPDYNGSDSFTYLANDGSDDSNIGTVTITVTPINDPPVLDAIDDGVTQAGVSIDVVLSASDVDGDVLSYSAVSDDDGIATELNGNILTLVPGDFYSGTAVVTVVASDGMESSNSESFALTVVAYDDVSLSSGWNLMSYDIFMDISEPEDVFADLVSDENLVVVTGYDETGFLFYEPAGIPELNTLESIEPGDGYFVKLYEDANIFQGGNFIPADYSVDLPQSWSILAYWIHQTMSPEEAFSALMDAGSLIYVTTFIPDVGLVFYDATGLPFLNTLTALDNGFGYMVKVAEAVDGFQYPAPSGLAAKQLVLSTNPEIVKTNVAMFVNGMVSFTGMVPEEGVRVNVHTESGLLIGEMDIVEGNYLRTGTLYGDDRTTEAVDGAVEGEQLIFTYNDIESEPVDIEFSGNMELTKIDLVINYIPESFTLHQNFPNPFNPVTTLRYDLPEQSFVRLTIYDMLGKEVSQLINTTQEAGFKSVQWNGTDNMGRNVGAGVYVYQIEAGGFLETRKMVLLK